MHGRQLCAWQLDVILNTSKDARSVAINPSGGGTSEEKMNCALCSAQESDDLLIWPKTDRSTSSSLRSWDEKCHVLALCSGCLSELSP